MGQRFEQDFGDVDVLAWNDSGKVLIIECKKLFYSKTVGEVSEQLSDYRGIIKDSGVKDDLLKHLNRLELIHSNLSSLRNYIGATSELTLKGYIVFSTTVPMQYAWEKLDEKTSIATFAELNDNFEK